MSGIVVDTSFALAWCFEDEATVQTENILDELRSNYAAVPAIWPLEVANSLLVAERRGRIDAAGLAGFVEMLDGLDIRVEHGDLDRELGETLALARRESLTSYDAAYLALAVRQGLPLATRDRKLVAAARHVGVTVIEA